MPDDTEKIDVKRGATHEPPFVGLNSKARCRSSCATTAPC
jgi:hypothetical protein